MFCNSVYAVIQGVKIGAGQLHFSVFVGVPVNFIWAYPPFGRKRGSRFSLQVLAPVKLRPFLFILPGLWAFHCNRLRDAPVNAWQYPGH